MDAQLKAKWVEALRSGEYEQAREMLHDVANGGYCCLGVLCKVMGAEFGPGSEKHEDEDGATLLMFDHVPVLDGRVLSNNDDEKLKDSLCKELGIPDQSELISRNDGKKRLGIHKHSFAEIADYIEKNL